MVLRKLGAKTEAGALLRETLALDPLDWWARHLAGQPLLCDLQVGTRPGPRSCARGILRRGGCIAEKHRPAGSRFARPIAGRASRWSNTRWAGFAGKIRPADAAAHLAAAAACPPDYCFPARLEEIAVLESAMRANPRRCPGAVLSGQFALRPPPPSRGHPALGTQHPAGFLLSVVWRNLGIGYFNILGRPGRARRFTTGVFARSERCAPLVRARPAVETHGRKRRRNACANWKSTPPWSGSATI